MKRILILTLITLIAVAATAAPGRRPPQGPQSGPGQNDILPPPLLADFLDLTEAQIAQVQSLRESTRAAVEPLRERQRENQEAIRAAVEAGNAAQAGALLVANHGIAQQIQAAHDAFETSFEALLTSAQKAKWETYQEIVELKRAPRD